ncbi:bifunctional phosphoribosyl-AMP cyclohydrolase/phosphoribosyl-ATP diphosphatase HisIE [Terrimonas sp. NA20]|uniref:Histidine biosynthesis bifunctional protein HisIE n=1 Tax=Terrimonas ginsenosidimutans TaxID=2908004 RepID=A0ABS9KYH9_9BACT|nr:bifunctional phosphoribosyl-AMP cyclohydrolase/phosphoribosyl-ATP diphosphatase HisIE [Terrimonas ginsenosidimutans]MCG2617395.1 bifunctional phosphoribosyl-AMP cyclohydrolase/phosphoribosyl-ATP diphosphatase HisIE [Terrimonas ginsenosidimutans]
MKIDFSKYSDGLVPVIIQDSRTAKVLMLGFMNEEALAKTQEIRKVTFFSRSKQRLWTKGEESGNFLLLESIAVDCDQDTLLVKAKPVGPVCHTGADTCFNETNKPAFLQVLSDTIRNRFEDRSDKSYTSGLFDRGINKVAQKVGEEAVELVIEAKDNDDDRFLNEASDLLFHYMVLLRAKGFSIDDVLHVLETRHK